MPGLLQTVLASTTSAEGLKKVIAGSILAYATYIVVTCPCTPLIECHKTHFWGSLMGAAFTIAVL